MGQSSWFSDSEVWGQKARHCPSSWYIPRKESVINQAEPRGGGRLTTGESSGGGTAGGGREATGEALEGGTSVVGGGETDLWRGCSSPAEDIVGTSGSKTGGA